MDNEKANLTDSPQQTEHSSNYKPIEHHWFYMKRAKDNSEFWQPFSKIDSQLLEETYRSGNEEIVATDGGRYDVDIQKRIKTPVYWEQGKIEVRRCSWFHKNEKTTKYEPYAEDIAAHIEEEYQKCLKINKWYKKIQLPEKDTIILYSPDEYLLFPPSLSMDDWDNSQASLQTQVRHRIRRGIGGFEIQEGEPQEVDHLLFMVHGIGSVCDLKFRTVQEVVDDFRSISLQLVKAHYSSSYQTGEANRIEVLPISWHDKLHSEDTGIDNRLKNITLDTIPKLRDFANDTILDVLFYTSPKYSQTIISTVGNELNRLYEIFKKRNPSFSGNVSLGGHSLGSLILFDLLAHQQTPNTDIQTQSKKKPDRRISHMYGAVNSGLAKIDYPKLQFQPTALFAMGSPIGMFVTVRGLDSLGKDFSLPTCSGFFNIFHPYDPVAYRIESLINSDLSSMKPMLIPHHKGRKRMHLELKETMARVGADLKQRVLDSMKHTWNTLFQLGIITTQANPCEEEQQAIEDGPDVDSVESKVVSFSTEVYGNLNKGRRVDYVLQESPLEMFNGYVSAITSHVCYWESEDTMLFILKEIYSSINIEPDNQIPRGTMTIERPLDVPGGTRL